MHLNHEMKTNNVIVFEDESNEKKIELLKDAKKTILDVQRPGKLYN